MASFIHILSLSFKLTTRFIQQVGYFQQLRLYNRILTGWQQFFLRQQCTLFPIQLRLLVLLQFCTRKSGVLSKRSYVSLFLYSGRMLSDS